MSDEFGSDFITIVDEENNEFELEVLTSVEYNGETYLAVTLAGSEDEIANLDVSILKSTEEDGEPILVAIEDAEELEAVYAVVMEQLYEEDED